MLLVFNHLKKHKTMFFFAEFALRECLVRNTEVSTFVLGHQHGQIVLPWLVGTKHVPESKNISQNPKTLHRIQNTSQNPKTRPRIQKHVPKSKTRPPLGPVFGFWEVFLDSGTCFVPTSHGLTSSENKQIITNSNV